MVIMKAMNVELNLLIKVGDLKDQSAIGHGCIIESKPNAVGNLIPQIKGSVARASKSAIWHLSTHLKLNGWIGWLNVWNRHSTRIFHVTCLFEPIAAHVWIYMDLL